jgi:SAM-dependent methyltransferase
VNVPWPFSDLLWLWNGSREASSLAFDREHGVETAFFDPFNYEPTRVDVIARTLDVVARIPEDWNFVDLGSGKGRVVLMASQRPFRKVVGVEWRKRLHRKAERNLAVWQSKGLAKAPVELIHGDAAEVEYPPDPLIVFLYNPFPAVVVAEVLRRLRNREVRLVYVNPVHWETMEAAGWATLARGDSAEEHQSWRIYVP